jgi:hypothetical protein
VSEASAPSAQWPAIAPGGEFLIRRFDGGQRMLRHDAHIACRATVKAVYAFQLRARHLDRGHLAPLQEIGKRNS